MKIQTGIYTIIIEAPILQSDNFIQSSELPADVKQEKELSIDPKRILKIRLAKGEISMDEYNELINIMDE